MGPAERKEPAESIAPVLNVPATRLASVDAWRGIVMILMVLDHVRDFFHTGAMSFSPEDLTRTDAVLFFTRWITHFCAPVFFFAAGIGAYLWVSRPGRTEAQLSRFLFTRGLWLIVLEFTLVRLAFFFSLTSAPLMLVVLWALGASMIALAVLCRLPYQLLAILSIATMALHHLADPIRADAFGSFAVLWGVLHQPGPFDVGGVIVLVAYPLIPWMAVMSAGYCFGRLLLLEPERRQRIMLQLGMAVTAGFLVLRAMNVYGDPVPWTSEHPVLSFLRCTKYPPSLLFLLMTLGPAIAVLSWLDRIPLSPRNPIVVIGRVPLFFFIAHLFLAHLLAIPLALARYGTAAFLWNPLPSLGGSADLYPAGFGYSLAVVYAVWAVVVVALYPLCVWLSQIKRRRTEWWWSYL